MSAAVSTLGADERVHLSVLTNSALACYARCPREYEYRYVKRRRPRRATEALYFGTFFHIGLNAWWLAVGDASARLEAALTALNEKAEAKPDELDEFELVKAQELLLGYTARWGDEDYEAIAVEQKIETALVNPTTGRESRTYRLQMKLDAIVRHRTTGKLRQLEHKTTSSDIGLGSDYWRKVSAMDPQVSTYQLGARAAGYDLEDCLYDVVRKVSLRPFKATPTESRRYTKSGKLDARQHEHDETPEEFRLRVREHITENPERYFARGPIVRLEHDERSHAADTWQRAQQIKQSENDGSFPRSPGACERFHTLCIYFDVCSGVGSIDDDNRFRTAETPHEELAEV